MPINTPVKLQGRHRIAQAGGVEITIIANRGDSPYVELRVNSKLTLNLTTDEIPDVRRALAMAGREAERMKLDGRV